jgi:hypothetical protein
MIKFKICKTNVFLWGNETLKNRQHKCFKPGGLL